MKRHQRRRALWGGLAVLMLGGAGCATGRGEVKDEWLARVPQEDLGNVYDARTAHRQSEDALMRAEVARKDARRDREIAEQEKKATSARVEAAETGLKAAHALGQADGIAKANQQLRTARAEEEAAKAKVEWSEAQVKLKDAERNLRQQQAEVTYAQVELAKFEALQQANDVRAERLNEAEFHSDIAQAQKGALEAESDLIDARREQQSARARYEVLQRATEAYGGSGY